MDIHATTEHLDKLYYTVPEAGAIAYGYGRSASYSAAKRGELPTIRVGARRLVVPRGALLKLFGFDANLG